MRPGKSSITQRIDDKQFAQYPVEIKLGGAKEIR
jgi:hypothetical protein